MLNKSNLSIPFGMGIDSKTDPKQVTPGKMLSLDNTIFQKTGLLQKRNGFSKLPALSDSTVNTLTTFGGSLTAVGASSLLNYSPETSTWYNKGAITAVSTEVLPLVRTSESQSRQDVAVAPSGLACAVWTDSTSTSYYQVIDTTSTQVVVAATALPATSSLPRVYVLGQHFIITYVIQITAAWHLQYIALPVLSPQTPGTAVDISTTLTSATAGYDGAVLNTVLYLAWSDVSGDLNITYLSSTLGNVIFPTIIAGYQATFISISTTDQSGLIWLSFWQESNGYTYAAALTPTLGLYLAPTALSVSANVVGLTSSASNGTVNVYEQIANSYTFTAARSDSLYKVSCAYTGGTTAPSEFILGVGLASKAFVINSKVYMMVAYGAGPGVAGGALQPTYFLIDDSGNHIAKLAYQNAGGYATTQVLPNANVSGNTIQIGYLYKDLITAVNKTQGVANVSGIYSQTGVNLVTWSIGTESMATSEIGSNLHLGGGILWMYDGAKPVEHGFQLYPEDIALTTATGGGGAMGASLYYYVVTYEWTDAQGNIHRSAPSVPMSINVGSSGSFVTINVPTLRITHKTGANVVRLVAYRASTAQPNYYQVTSVTSPTLNDTTVNSVTIVDLLADSAILGNQLVYTTGGVVENIAAPASTDIALFKSRLVLIDAEDKNLLWYSKQVIEATPVETSDLFTQFIAPTTGAQGSTGPNTALSAMDDKLIIFKRDAIYYITGTGPDNTGANNDFSDPNYITSTAGCTNPRSIVYMPQGLMFQSDKGIWLLARDLSTNYIGAPVEAYNNDTVVSAVNVPGTNQVRFTLDSGVTLMYDYFFGQWGTFSNIPAVASTLYQYLHTFVNDLGQVFQESVGSYVDGSTPVLMSFKTGWMSLAGLQGFERAYFFYLLGTYLSPHILTVQIAYDYDPAIIQTTTITPDNYNPLYGQEAGPYGSGSPYGGNSTIEQWRVFLQNQKCQSFQITITESYDSTLGVAPGAGLTLSGLNLVVGSKKGYVPMRASRSVG